MGDQKIQNWVVYVTNTKLVTSTAEEITHQQRRRPRSHQQQRRPRLQQWSRPRPKETETPPAAEETY